MANVTILYTSTDQIRAALGVTLLELSDQAILDFNAEMRLRVELKEWLPTHATIYSEGTAGGATETQIHKKDILVLYSQAFLAAQLVVPAAMFAAQKVADNATEMQRFQSALENLQVNLLGQAEDLKKELLEELGTVITAWKPMAAVSPLYDPVVGPEVI